MSCVRPAFANGFVFKGSGALPNEMGITPDPVGACGYSDGAITLVPGKLNAAVMAVAAELGLANTGAMGVPVPANAAPT